MDRSEVVNLISETYSKNSYGVVEAARTSKQVYCNVTSVSSDEWFEGGRNGLNPEYRIRMFKFDYEGEKLAEYKGIVYTIYRTYEARNDIIELYLEKDKGNE